MDDEKLFCECLKFFIFYFLFLLLKFLNFIRMELHFLPA